MANLRFMFGTKEKYNALTEKDQNALYFVTDESTGEVSLYKGPVLWSRGNEASTSLAGLMSPADKAKLDSLSSSGELVEFTPLNASITISDDNKIGVALSAEEGNALTLKSDGLYVSVSGAPAGDSATYTIAKAETPDEGMYATYSLQKTVDGETTIVGEKINIPVDKDKVLASAELKIVEVADQPYTGAIVGDPYLDLGFNDPDATHIYVPMKDIVGEAVQYTAGNGIDITNNVVSVNLASEANGLQFVDGAMTLGLASATSAGALSAVDKAFIDSISTTYATKSELSTIGNKVDTLEGALTWGELT